MFFDSQREVQNENKRVRKMTVIVKFKWLLIWFS